MDTKRLLFLFLLFPFLTSLYAQRMPRKKVAVVLSGGGAKGAAHARALKVIEEAGIPVDYVVGTSIGALVGGMYASGYNADQIDSIMTHQNWKTLLTDASTRKEKDLLQRQRTDNYMLTVQFEKSPFEIIEGGLLKGNNVARLLTELTADTPDSIDFRKLKIPFACVATDLVTGEEVDLYSGVLAECMRASMAIPGAFTPVKKAKQILVDGGMANNFPVDVARKMGADYVIGVNLNNGVMPYEKLNTTQAVFTQLLDLTCGKKVEENIKATDVYIQVNVEGYSAASFSNAAIDTLLIRGEKAARDKWDELIALRNKLGLRQPVAAPAPRAEPEHRYDVVPVPSIYKDKERSSFLGVGARFDNEELARLLIGGMYEINHKNHLRIGLEGRFGKRISALAYGSVNLGKSWTTQLSYQFTHNEYSLYNKGKRITNEDFLGNVLQLTFSHNWNNFRAWVGTSYSRYKFDDILVHKDYVDLAEDTEGEASLNYFARLTYDNRNASSNATRGMMWSVGYRFLTHNGIDFYGKTGLHIADANFSVAIPLSTKATLVPSVAARWIPERNDFFTEMNFIGGVNSDGHYMPQQMAFAGINYLQLARNELFVSGLTYRQQFFKNFYAFLVGNYGFDSNGIFQGKNVRHMCGAALGAGYKTPVGPIEANFNWSNMTRKLGFFVNLGYMF